ncbi:3'-5' exonuclease [Paludibacterium yongneupense]|uniref:3'-5' exonuclease n=1 Tax=Paludibacterium yongneupense TaxID=400061 RepID=UPI00040A4FBC|nr:3'-5' exonuclease [Paludibacterium yongneupense]
MIPVLSFDIETIPDIAGIRTLYGFDDELPDAAVAEFALQKRRAQNGSDFLPHHLHRVLAISCVLRWSDKIIIKTIGQAGDSEAAMLGTFFDTIARYTPQLVSWNGGGFDLPVMHYRALINGVAAPRYWETGDGDHADSRDFKWNNYLGRYHTRHLDLMDMLALYQPRASAPLDDMAKLCGFPGKLGMDGSKVWSAYQDGQTEAIRDYCETDAANTYLVYLRFQQMRGHLSTREYDAEIAMARDWVAAQDKMHWREFLAAWPARGNGEQGLDTRSA